MKSAYWKGGGIIVALLLLCWLAGGLVVWQRNAVPQPPVLQRDLPSANVYPQYVALVTQVQQPRRILLLYRQGARGREVEELLRANERVLAELRRLNGKASAVTELKPGARFVGALAFPDVTRLVALEVRRDAASQPAKALDTLLAGFHFAHGVQQEGAVLHLTTGFLAYVPLFETAPALLPRLEKAQLRRAAAEVRQIRKNMTPLKRIMEAERCVRLDQLASTVRPGASRIFRFDIPKDSYDWSFLLKPKRPAYDALNAYLTKWVALAEAPLSQVQPPPFPTELQGILDDESLHPDAMAVHFIRYYYLRARLAILETACHVEGYRKEKGAYPARLSQCIQPDSAVDPFSGAALVYRRLRAGYVLYSVGPNGRDDGGQPYTESRMRPDVTGDLLLQPNF